MILPLRPWKLLGVTPRLALRSTSTFDSAHHLCAERNTLAINQSIPDAYAFPLFPPSRPSVCLRYLGLALGLDCTALHCTGTGLMAPHTYLITLVSVSCLRRLYHDTTPPPLCIFIFFLSLFPRSVFFRSRYIFDIPLARVVICIFFSLFSLSVALLGFCFCGFEFEFVLLRRLRAGFVAWHGMA